MTLTATAGIGAVTSTEPQIVQRSAAKVATVTVTGTGRVPAARALRALYGSVAAVQAAHREAGTDFEVGPLRARIPEAQTGPLSSWRWDLAVEIPPGAISMPQIDRDVRVGVEVWVCDVVAEVLHEGTEATKPVTVKRLMEFALARGYRPTGPREEIYLGTGPAGGRTVVRYAVVPRGVRLGGGAC